MTQQTTNKRAIRLVVIDLDGTLLNHEHIVSPRVEQALTAALAQGVQIVLATGKTRTAGIPIIEQFGLTTPGIYVQGLVVYDPNGAVTHQLTLDPALVRQVITFVEDRGFSIAAYAEGRILSPRYSKSLEDELTLRHEVAPDVVGPLQNRLDTLKINKLIVWGEARAITGLRWQLNMQIGSAGRLIQPGIRETIELLPPGGSKAWALKQILKDMKIDAANVLAIGDGENDIEMLQLAGIGVAMGQSIQQVKDAADHVVASNEKDGVAEALEKFVLDTPLPELKPAAAPATPVTPEAQTETSAEAQAVGTAKETGDYPEQQS